MTYAFATSTDGVRIGYSTVGRGPGVVVVPGALAVASDLAGLAGALAPDFTVHVLDRRGRGQSGDDDTDYSIERECDDVAAVQAATGATFLFGHSFGGLVALEAALRIPTIAAVAAYEPGVSIGGSVRVDWTDRSARELADGRGLDAFVVFARGANPQTTGRLPHALVKLIIVLALRREEREQKVALLPTAIREHVEAARLDDTHHRYCDIDAPVLLLAGKKGPTAGSVGRTLPEVRRVLRHGNSIELSGLDHLAPEKRPDQVARSVSAFFREGR